MIFYSQFKIRKLKDRDLRTASTHLTVQFRGTCPYNPAEGYPINTIIKKQYTESDYTYFVVRGTIEVFREIELDNCEQYHRE